jgi:hypothetical protein
MGWRAKADSSVGVSHQKRGIPCQDSAHYDFVDEIVIGAVADGAGSAKWAEEGAQISVKVATDYLKNWIRSEKKQVLKVLSRSEKDLYQLFTKEFTNILGEVLRELKKEASQSRSQLKDYACTLLVFVAAPDWLAAMQLGDGFIVIKPLNREYQLLFQPDKGEFANQTTFVTSSNSHRDMKVRIFQEPQQFICASTDGLERVAILFSNWTPSPNFFDPFREYISSQKYLDNDPNYLQTFLSSDLLNGRTDDDKTLLLCFYDSEISQRELPPIRNNAENHTLSTTLPRLEQRDYLLIQHFISSFMAGGLMAFLTPISWKQIGIFPVFFPVFIGAVLSFSLAILLALIYSDRYKKLKWLILSLCTILPGIFAVVFRKHGFHIIENNAPVVVVFKDIYSILMISYFPFLIGGLMSILVFTTVSRLSIVNQRKFNENLVLALLFSFPGFLLGLFIFVFFFVHISLTF